MNYPLQAFIVLSQINKLKKPLNAVSNIVDNPYTFYTIKMNISGYHLSTNFTSFKPVSKDSNNISLANIHQRVKLTTVIKGDPKAPLSNGYSTEV